MEETEYRRLIQKTFERVQKAFDDVDPDIAECENAQGALTIQLADRTKCILSAQPSVRQLWMALASKGTAVHFNFDAVQQQWIDDKGRGLELISYLKSYLHEATGQDFAHL